MSRRLVAFGLLLTTALIYSPAGYAQDGGQWERVSVPSGQSKASNTPHPLAYFLHFSPERNIDTSLCLGCKTKSGRTVTIDDYAVKPSQRPVGESFGRQIMEVDLTFDMKPGSVMSQLRSQWEQDSQTSFESLTPVEWQSIIMQSAPNLYRELYFDSNGPQNSVPPVDARIVDVEGVPLLAVRETYPGWCAEGYWVLDQDGPWFLDFSPVEKAIANVIPPNSTAPVTGCWALSIENLEVNAHVQEKHPECEACGWLGTAVVDFRIENDRAIPVSSVFEPSASQ